MVFSDYMRPAVRLAALMKTAVTYVWTHDSIGLGEDGPTHQPVEHLAALRAIDHIDNFHNAERRHSYLGNLSPMEYEKLWADIQPYPQLS